MENALMTFEYQRHDIRTIVRKDGDTWFVAKDVCECLDVTWSGGKILAKIPERWKQTREIYDPNGRMQMMICVNEPAMYKLAFRSNKPEAKAFRKWVTSDVLPSIRKTGKYELPEEAQRLWKIMKGDLALRIIAGMRADIRAIFAIISAYADGFAHI